MYNMVIFPYDATLKNTLQHIDQKEYRVCGIVSPRGWGYGDTSLLIGDEEIVIQASLRQVESAYDCICLVNSRYSLNFTNSIMPIIHECAEKNLDVIVCRDFTEQELQIIKSYIDKDKLHILYETYRDIKMENEIFEIDIPVVLITDIFAELNSQDVQLKIYDELKAKGYAVKLVSSKREMRLIRDIDSIPQSVLREYGTNKEKILRFNHYIKQIEIKENPDLIIIGIPGNLMEISKKVTGDFGSSAYIISRGVISDYVVCNFPYFQDFEGRYSELCKCVENRLETKVDACNVIPQYLDLMESEEYGELEYLGLSAEYVEKKLQKHEKIFFLQDKKEILRIADEIVKKLEGYAEIKVM